MLEEKSPFCLVQNPTLIRGGYLKIDGTFPTLLSRIVFTISPYKSCGSDPAPTQIVPSDCLDEPLPALTVMINLPLKHGHFTDAWKQVLIKPKLKT